MSAAVTDIRPAGEAFPIPSWDGACIVITGGRDRQATVVELAEAINFAEGVRAGQRHKAWILHGGATGIDAHAGGFFEFEGWPVAACPANWKRDGRKSGPLRNRAMVARASALIAWPGGSGTADCVRRAKAKGIPVFYPAGEPK